MEQNQTISKFSINPGLTLGGIMVLISVILYILGVNPFESSWVGWVTYPFTAGVIFYYQKNYRNTQNDGFLSLGEAVKLGVTIAVIAGIVAAIYNIIFTQFIEPDFIEKGLMIMEEKMLEQNPDMPQSQIDMALGMVRKMQSPYISVPLSIVFNAISGLIIGLITGFFTKKNNPSI